MQKNDDIESMIELIKLGATVYKKNPDEGFEALKGNELMREQRNIIKYLCDQRKDLEKECKNLTSKLEFIKQQTSKSTEQRLLDLEESVKMIRESVGSIDRRTIGLQRF